MSKYYEKYIKYKSKYNLVKEQIGGVNPTSTMVTYTTDIPVSEIDKNYKNTSYESGVGFTSTFKTSYKIGLNFYVNDNGITENRTYNILYKIKYPENLSDNNAKTIYLKNFFNSDRENEIYLVFKEARTSATIIDDISIGIDPNDGHAAHYKEYYIKNLKNIKFKSSGQDSDFKSFHDYIKDLGAPTVLSTNISGGIMSGRTIYPDFHGKLNKITITCEVTSGKIHLITINFPQL